MNKQRILKKVVSSLTALALILLPAVHVNAASEYTVTFRPGNVGNFGIVSEENKSVKEMAQEVADIYYSAYETSVTENGAIKVKVPAGAGMPAAPGYVIPKEGYYVRPWGPQAGEIVTKNVDFVADYGRLTDGVEYTVKYVDSESQESVAPFMTAYGNIGDEITVNAPAALNTSGEGVYMLVSNASCTIKLAAEADENVIVFDYEYNYEPETIEQEVVTVIPGDTVVTTQTNVTYVDNGTVAEPGAAVIQTPEDNVDNNDEQEQEQGELVELEEEDIPLADGVKPEADGSESEAGGGMEAEEAWNQEIEIEDEETPLVSEPSSEGNSVTMIVLAAVIGILTLFAALTWLQLRKKTVAEEEEK